MIEEFYNYFTIETLFWVNLGVLILVGIIFFPYSNLSRYFITSIFQSCYLVAYIFLSYTNYLNSYDL